MSRINENPYNCLLILYDCPSDINMHEAKGIKTLYTRGRHSFIAICVISQNFKSVSPTMRNNSDYILSGQLNAANIESL